MGSAPARSAQSQTPTANTHTQGGCVPPPRYTCIYSPLAGRRGPGNQWRWEANVHLCRRVFQKYPERLERCGKSRRIAGLPQAGKFSAKLDARKWVLLEKDLDFVIISDAIRRRF